MDSTTEVLDVVRKVAEQQDVMFRRQIALEQVFREIRGELAAFREQAVQAAEYGKKIAVLEYQVSQLSSLQDKQGLRLSILLPAILILLAVLAVAAGLSFLR